MKDMNVMIITVKMFTLGKHVKNTHCRVTRHTIVPHAVNGPTWLSVSCLTCLSDGKKLKSSIQ